METPPDASPRIENSKLEILEIGDHPESNFESAFAQGTRYEEYSGFKPVKKRKKYSKEFIELFNSNE